MTSPHDPATPGVPPPLRARPAPAEPGWLEAVALGVRDTAKEMLAEGRRVARAAYEDGWRDYEAKTRHRRKGRDRKAG